MKRTTLIVMTSLFAFSPSFLFAQNLAGNNLTLSGSITQNGFGNNFFNGVNNTFRGRACIGPSCDGSEPFEQGPLRLKWSEPDILFQDSSSTSGISSNDWRLVINDSITTKFAVQDIDGGTIPFTIEGGVPENSFYLEDTGDVGFGTGLPAADLHIVKASTIDLRMQTTGANPYTWSILSNQNGFSIFDRNTGRTPLFIEDGAPNLALTIQDDGNIGVGTNIPGAPLELSSSGSFNFFRISATGAAINESVDITFTGGPLGTGQLRYNIVDGDNQEMSLDADGNMVLDGTLTTAGPTCAAGCDRVFDADYDLLSIEDRAEAMFAAGHLPAIGATVPHAPVNVTEKLGNVVNELEHAHIYIAQLNDEMAEMRRNMETLQARLRDLEHR